jgi:uncharacterized membrane protein YqgA involved in biofilm formation
MRAARHYARMTGAFLNALGILLGSLYGLAARKLPALRTEVFFRSALGAFTVFFGLRLVWLSLNGTFLACAKQFFLAALAVVIGNWIGKILRLQKISNRLGRHAANIIASAQKNPPANAFDGLNACALLFCAAPLGLLGAVTDGLSGYFFPLAVKAAMDGFAMVSFVKMFRWPCALAAIPVFIFFTAITTVVQIYAAPFLNTHHLTDSVQAAAGLIICAVALVIFEVRRVELNSYLPALLVAPLLAHWFA